VKNAYLNNSKKVIYTPNNIKFDFTKNIKYNAEFNRKEHEMALKDILHIMLNMLNMETKLISSFIDGKQIYFK